MRRFAFLLAPVLAACSAKGPGASATAGYRAESAAGGEEASAPLQAPPPTGNVAALGPASFSAELSDDGRVLFDGDRPRDGLSDGAVAGSFADNSGKWAALRGQLSAARTRRASYTAPPEPAAGGPDLRPGVDVPGIPPGGALSLTEYQRFQQTVYATVYPVLTRLGWKARPRDGAPTYHAPYRITIHHTMGHQTRGEADTARELRDIQAFHQGPERGWADIGYHFLIDGDGRVAEGRPSNVLGAHALNENTGNLGISMMGDFNKVQPTARQMDSLERLSAYLALKYGIDVRKRGYLEGHFHHQPTSCPGAHLKARLGELRAKVLEEESALARSGSTDLASFQPLVVSRRA